ncbi:hypothetical protein CXZ10_20365 [Pleomorphomonas diazotrophica]|uniref:Lipoprotein n=2 Tax=Pleomorphomonas diazotrophica TaxID=1166257 RepID=A0A2N3LRV6_9HYPH|nr:hypothetical protein CXZ10_20365 [Pleomorphomonas diazotrophica]
MCLKKTIGITALLLAMAGCNTPPRLPPASEAEQTASIEKFIACLDKNVSKMDDRVSDAATIASALLEGPCAAANAASKETYTRDMTERERIAFEANATAPFQVALDMVIRHRKGARAPARVPAEAPAKQMQ